MKLDDYFTKEEQIFQRLKAQQPEPGDILETFDGEPIFLKINKTKEKPVVYCHAMIDTDQEKWGLTEEDVGIICLILPYSWEKIELDNDGKEIATRILVKRYTRKETALLVEIVE